MPICITPYRRNRQGIARLPQDCSSALISHTFCGNIIGATSVALIYGAGVAEPSFAGGRGRLASANGSVPLSPAVIALSRLPAYRRANASRYESAPAAPPADAPTPAGRR